MLTKSSALRPWDVPQELCIKVPTSVNSIMIFMLSKAKSNCSSNHGEMLRD